MERTYKIATSDLNLDFIEKIKKSFQEGILRITVQAEKRTDSYKQGLKDIEDGNVHTFQVSDFVETYEQKVDEALSKSK